MSMRPDPSHDTAPGAVLLQVQNPGAARVRWSLVDQRWTLEGGASSVMLPPGALQELRLLPQSS